MGMPDAIGLCGAVLYLTAYALLQLGRITISDPRYALMNICGAIAIIVSLMWSFNLGSLVTQSAWLLFTILGLLRSRKRI